MQITYRTNSLERQCTDFKVARKDFGKECALILHQRIGELEAADSIEMMTKFGIGRCHPLHGDRKKQYALDLIHPLRLIIKEEKSCNGTVIVVSIEDYH